MDAEENIGKLSVYPNEVEDFAFCNNSCDGLKFQGIPFTWWNGWVDEDCNFKRLERVVVNQLFMDDIR